MGLSPTRHQEMELVTGFPCPLASPKCFVDQHSDTSHCLPLPKSKGVTVSRANAPEVLPVICQPSLYIGSWINGLEKGVVMTVKEAWPFLFASFVPEMVVHCHSQPETYLCLIWDKGMGFYLLFKDTHIQNQARLLSTQRCLPQESCRC